MSLQPQMELCRENPARLTTRRHPNHHRLPELRSVKHTQPLACSGCRSNGLGRLWGPCHWLKTPHFLETPRAELHRADGLLVAPSLVTFGGKSPTSVGGESRFQSAAS